MPAVDVFSKCLSFMKEHLVRAVAAHQGDDPDLEAIRWVITVPAIWDDNAKQFMREAAFKVMRVYKISYV